MKQLKAANDNYLRESRRPIACPTMARFIKNDDAEGIRALMLWRDLTRPGDPFNPEAVPSSIYQDDDPELVPQPEREINKGLTRRELEYIEAAANDNNGRPTFDNHGQAHLGGLTFRDGRCVTPGVFGNGPEFGKVKTTSTPNGYGAIGEEAYATSFEAEIVRESEERNARDWLGELADVLDMACADHTAEQIGRISDESQSAAERRGKKLISDAINEFLRQNDTFFQIAA